MIERQKEKYGWEFLFLGANIDAIETAGHYGISAANSTNFIQDDDAPAPADAASHTLLKEQLADVLKTLTPREEKVLRLRFGLDDGRPHTLEEVGEEFDITRERIRQIEAKALRKLRHPTRAKRFGDYRER